MAYRIIHYRSLSFSLSRNYSDGNKQTVAATHNIHTISSWFDDDDVQLIFFLFSQKSVPFGFLRLIFSCGGFFSHVYYEKKDSRHPPTTFLFLHL